MFSQIIRSLFFIACTITGGMWALYIFEYYERANFVSEERVVPIGVDASRAGESDTEEQNLASADPTKSSQLDSLKYSATHASRRWMIPYLVTLGGAVGFGVAMVITFLLRLITQEAFERFFPALVSVLLAIAIGWLLAWYIVQILGVRDLTLQIYIQATLVIVCFFVGVNLGLTRTSSWENLVRAVSRKSYEGRYPKLLDTSVIIDGRIADICKAGFVEGTLIVPRFVLHELQAIADSTDTLRRARGRRGLDVLKQLQAPDSGVAVEVVEDNPQQIHTVDGKLVALAKDIAAKVVTNDQNLLKVAQIEGVSVMNIHDLASALKTVVLPDEQMHVRVVREGKEPQQGVGFLDDGTMVVVDGGRDHVGRNVVAIVTSVLQTSNGRMIFTRLQSADAR